MKMKATLLAALLCLVTFAVAQAQNLPSAKPEQVGLSSYLPGAGFGFGLGFAVRKDAGVSPFAGTVGELNWGGAGGTYFWIDPKEDMVVVFMMQSPKQRVPYRYLLKEMVYAAVTKPAK